MSAQIGPEESTAEQPRSSNFPLLLVTLAVVAVAMVLLNRVFQAVQPGCENVIHETVTAPDGELAAVLFERNCGATAGFSSQVSVIRVGEALPDQAGNALVAVNGETPGTAPWGGPLVVLSWPGSDQLELRVDPAAVVTSSSDSSAGATIHIVR